MNLRLAEYVYYFEQNDIENARIALEKTNKNLKESLINNHNIDTANLLINSLYIFTIKRIDVHNQLNSNKERVKLLQPYIDNIIKVDFNNIDNKVILFISVLALLEYIYELDKDIPNMYTVPIVKNVGYIYLAQKRCTLPENIKQIIYDEITTYSDKELIRYDELEKNLPMLLNRFIMNDRDLLDDDQS